MRVPILDSVTARRNGATGEPGHDTGPRYPPALRHVNRALHLLPRPFGEHAMAGFALAHALARPRRLRRAVRWASAQCTGGWPRGRLVVSLFLHHGRLIAQDALVGIRHPDALRRALEVRGLAHLDAVAPGQGAILLGFHLGPLGSWFALRTLGRSVAFVGRPELLGLWPHSAWLRPLMRPEDCTSISGHGPTGRLQGLCRARQLLEAGRTIFIAADGPFGAEAFRIALPGGPAVIRGGWLALRRLTGAVTLPILSHREGRRWVLTVYPPLPGPDPDRARDLAACREILAGLLHDYVRRFPEQCRWLAFGD
jgi:lauroyl/myristoyl acyltransferase